MIAAGHRVVSIERLMIKNHVGILMTDYYYAVDPATQAVMVFETVNNDDPQKRLKIVARDVSSTLIAKTLIQTLEEQEKERQARVEKAQKEYEEMLKNPHRFLRVSLRSSMCECGKSVNDDIHIVLNVDHVYSPENQEDVYEGKTLLCRCGRTKNDPHHLEESEL